MNFSTKYNSTGKYLIVCSVLCILCAVLIIATTPLAEGYEISLYNVYPPQFWILLLIPLVLPIITIILKIRITSLKTLMLLLATSAYALLLLLSIPIFRGYILYGAGDTLTHLGLIKELSINHHIGTSNPYPYIHVLIYTISQLTRCSPETVSLCIPQIFALFLVTSIYILSRALTGSQTESFAITSFAIIPVLGTWITTEYIMPATVGYSFIPILLYLIPKPKKSLEYDLITLVAIACFWFIHPESVLYLCIALLTVSICLKIGTVHRQTNRKYKTDLLIFSLFLGIGFLLWALTTPSMESPLRVIYNAIVLDTRLTEAVIPSTIQSLGNWSVYDIIRRGILEYGQLLPFFIIAAIYASKIIKDAYSKEDTSPSNLIITSLFISYCLFAIFTLTFGTLVSAHIFRQLKYPYLLSVFLVGLFFARTGDIWSQPGRATKLGNIIMTLLILSAPIIAISNTYPSPDTHKFNYQVTLSDVSGMNLFLNHRNVDYPIVEMIWRSYQSRFADYIMGIQSPKENIRRLYAAEDLTPPHLGYDTNYQLGSIYNQTTYMLAYPPAYQFYSSVFPNDKASQRYSQDDFQMLYRDETVNYISNNGQLKVLLINKQH